MASFFKSLFASILGFFVALFLLIMGIAVIGAMATASKAPQVQSGSTLYMQVPIAFLEYPAGTARPFGDPPLTLHDLRMNLRKAAVDKRIDRVVLSINMMQSPWASLEELRSEVAAVRKAGKPVIAHLEWLNMRGYYLATACDSIWMEPDGFITLEGVSAERMFRKGLMDKLGVVMRTHKIEKYKAAGEIDIRTDMSPEARENAQWILDETMAKVRGDILADRGRDEAWWNRMLELVAPLPHEAVELGLIDGVAYWNDLKDRWQGPDTEKGKSRIVSGEKYAGVKAEELGLRGKLRVAVIHAQGAIAGAKSGENPLLGGVTMGYETINKEIRKVARDKRIDAVVFRVDSPGGSSYASDLMRHQVAMLEAKKPLVVSMGDAAASGGYMISYPCSMIVANTTTRTGSIGSIFSVPNARGLMDKLGLTFDRVTYGPNATMTSLVMPWTAAQESIVVRQHWKSYNEWVADVARVRGMTFEQVDAIARGRVWTGAQAAANGLVDSVGTLSDAIAIAARMAGAKEGDKVTEVHYPKQVTFFEALQAGDFPMAREILARTIWNDATEPARTAWENIEFFYMSPELAIDEEALR